LPHAHFDGVAHQAVLLDDVGHDALGGDRGPVDVFRRAAEYQGDPVDLILAERRSLCDQLFDLVGVAVAPANRAPLATAGVSVVAVGVSFINHADHPSGHRLRRRCSTSSTNSLHSHDQHLNLGLGGSTPGP
jgi:hypothetical protein